MTSSLGAYVIVIVQLMIITSGCFQAPRKFRTEQRSVQILVNENASEEEKAAAKFLQKLNVNLTLLQSETALKHFDFLTDMTDEKEQALNEAQVAASLYHQAFISEARKHYENVDNYGNEMVKRMLKMLVEYDLSLESPSEEETRERSKVESRMTHLISTATVTYEGEALTMEPGLADVMASTFDYDVLRDVWVQWRNATHGMRDDFTWLAEFSNKRAQSNGFKDLGEYLRESDFEMPSSDVDALLEKLWQQVEPLYQQLHAYVRRKLIQQYPGRGIREDGPIPAHLLGNMWAQAWNNLLPIAMPFPKAPTPDVTPQMKSQGYTPKKMFELADSFFISLGMDPMTDTFWEKSVITKSPDKDMDCHGSAHDLHRKDDYRIKMCTRVDMDYLKTVHHEMGHVQYYMNYAHQPVLFQTSAHSGFHEAVGDTIALSVMTQEHLRKINLLPVEENEDPEKESDINMLMRMALEKIPLLPWAYLVDKWRWDVYSGDITPDNYNSKWWEYRLKYQGLEPPVERRDPEDFDPAAKYHVAADVPYIRYFVSFISQFQFQKTLCDASGHIGSLHKCDIYQSKETGNKLRGMLSAGASKPWWEVMEKMTGSPKMDAGALLEYFQPLMDFLREVNHDEYIGWR